MQNITIQNESLTVDISSLGAELQSIIKDKTQYLWQGDPAIWSGRAPVLFPIVGRLKRDHYTYRGHDYSLMQHGFARKSIFEVKEVDKSKAIFSLKSSSKTRVQYPFDFELLIEYRLIENNIDVKYIVNNKTDGEMLFSIGSHEGYCCPIDTGAKFTDYYMEFEKNEHLERAGIVNGLIAKEKEQFLTDSKLFALTHDLFNNDAIVLEGLKSTTLSLKSNESQRAVKVSFEGFPYMGIWQKLGAPYICIEPWHGIADSVDVSGDLAEKKGINNLKKGEEFECVHNIEIV